jgi:hypothetical protein
VGGDIGPDGNSIAIRFGTQIWVRELDETSATLIDEQFPGGYWWTHDSRGFVYLKGEYFIRIVLETDQRSQIAKRPAGHANRHSDPSGSILTRVGNQIIRPCFPYN